MSELIYLEGRGWIDDADLAECSNCGRLRPTDEMTDGECKECITAEKMSE